MQLTRKAKAWTGGALACALAFACALALGGCGRQAPAEGPSWQDQAVLTWSEKLKDPDPWVRASAVSALAELGEAARPAAGLLLVLVREDPALEVRRRSALALGRLGAEQALPDLLALLDAGEPKLVGAAAEALVALDLVELVLEEGLERLDAGPSLAGLDALAQLFAAVGDAAVAPLTERLSRHHSLELRRSAALCLGRLGPPARPASPAIALLLDEADSHSRLAAVLALSSIGGPEACRELARTAATDPDAGLRLEALLNGAVPCDFQPAETEIESEPETVPELGQDD